MGTDLNIYVECKNDDNTWSHVGLKHEINYRNYTLYSILGGFYDDNQLVKGRDGFPDDLSKEVIKYHSPDITWGHNYYTLREIKDFNWQQLESPIDTSFKVDEKPLTYAELCLAFYNKTIPELEELAKQYNGPDNVRVIISFLS